MKRKYTLDELKAELENYGKVDRNEFYGESWRTGGTRWGFMGDKQPIEPEKPRKFVEMHKLLKDKFPSLSYMSYLEIEDKCFSTENDYESDYYTESTVTYWVCDLRELVNLLPCYDDTDFQTTCSNCGEVFRFNKEDIEDMDGGLMGDWRGVCCPHCGKYIETYPGNRTDLHE